MGLNSSMRARRRRSCKQVARHTARIKTPAIAVPASVPDSEVRIILPQPRLRTSESKDTSNFMILVPLFDLKFLNERAAGGVGTSNRRHRPQSTIIQIVRKRKPRGIAMLGADMVRHQAHCSEQHR